MTPAAYTPTTLARIRAGASAAELGWGCERYQRICERHKLPQAVRVVPGEHPRSKVLTYGPITYEMREGHITRGQTEAALLGGPRQCVVFTVLLERLIVGDESPISREELIEKTGGCSFTAIGKAIAAMRVRLEPVRMRILADIGRIGGYRLVIDGQADG
jgi:hypothetical protein